jgi:hypothetical protein
MSDAAGGELFLFLDAGRGAKSGSNEKKNTDNFVGGLEWWARQNSNL